MRLLCLLLGVLAMPACSDKSSGEGEDEGGDEIDPTLKTALDGTTEFSLDIVYVSNSGASCADDTWTVNAETWGFEGDLAAERMVVVTWDVEADTFSGGWSLTEGETNESGQTAFSGEVSADEVGISCDGAGSSTFVAFPVVGTAFGAPGGASVGSITGLGYESAWEEGSASLYAYTEESVDGVAWRAADLAGNDDDEEGTLESTGEGSWEGPVSWDGMSSSFDAPPLHGVWGLSGDVATGAGAL